MALQWFVEVPKHNQDVKTWTEVKSNENLAKAIVTDYKLHMDSIQKQYTVFFFTYIYGSWNRDMLVMHIVYIFPCRMHPVLINYYDHGCITPITDN